MAAFRLFLLASFVCGALAQNCDKTWFDCGSNGGTVNAACMTGCTQAPCVVHSGVQTSMWYTFTPSMEFDSLNQTAWGDIKDVWLKLPGGLTTPEICNIVKCPLKVGQTYNITAELVVPTFPIEVVLKAEVRLDNKPGDKPPNKVPFCLMFEIDLKP